MDLVDQPVLLSIKSELQTLHRGFNSIKADSGADIKRFSFWPAEFAICSGFWCLNPAQNFPFRRENTDP